MNIPRIRPKDCLQVSILSRSKRKTVEYLVKQKLGEEAALISDGCYHLKLYQKKGWEEKYRLLSEQFAKITGFTVDDLIKADGELRIQNGLPQLR